MHDAVAKTCHRFADRNGESVSRELPVQGRGGVRVGRELDGRQIPRTA